MVPFKIWAWNIIHIFNIPITNRGLIAWWSGRWLLVTRSWVRFSPDNNLSRSNHVPSKRCDQSPLRSHFNFNLGCSRILNHPILYHPALFRATNNRKLTIGQLRLWLIRPYVNKTSQLPTSWQDQSKTRSKRIKEIKVYTKGKPIFNKRVNRYKATLRNFPTFTLNLQAPNVLKMPVTGMQRYV